MGGRSSMVKGGVVRCNEARGGGAMYLRGHSKRPSKGSYSAYSVLSISI